jgi:hypothetical protein
MPAALPMLGAWNRESMSKSFWFFFQKELLLLTLAAAQE